MPLYKTEVYVVGGSSAASGSARLLRAEKFHGLGFPIPNKDSDTVGALRAKSEVVR